MMKHIGTIFGIILYSELCISQLHSNKYWPFNKNVATSRATPINVNVFSATPIKVTPLLQNRVCNERGLLVNTGKGVEVRTTQTSQGFLKGGVLYNETYIYHSTRFFWSNNTKIVENSINGAGTTLAVENYYYNKKYSNFNNSLNHYDGLAIISILIFVGSTPNPLFNSFRHHLESVTRPESQLNIDIGSSFIWNDYLARTGNYFAYPGSYTTVDNSRIYNCATVIIQPFSPASPFISREQFACSFGLLKNSDGKPLTYVSSTYPAAGRPISSVMGFQKIFLPLNIIN